MRRWERFRQGRDLRLWGWDWLWRLTCTGLKTGHYMGSLIRVRFGLRGGAGLKAAATLGVGKAVVVVVVDGVADGFAPAVGAEGVDVFVLGEVDGLQESLRQVGDGAGGSGLYIAADDGGDKAAQGGAEIAGGEVVGGEEVVEVLAERFFSEGAGFFLGVVEAEMGIFAGARGAATAAIRERELTQGHTVLGTERRHKSLLRVEFWDYWTAR